MILKYIAAKNFLTYKDFKYSFENKSLMVQGLNLTDDKQKSNGSGKSSIQAMIEFCLTGDNSRGVRDVNLITFGQKESFLELSIYCPIRLEEVIIQWEIRLKGSNKLNISKIVDGNKEGVIFSNVNDGKKWIIGWLGISKNDLFNYFIINKTRFKSFLKGSNKEKIELINRFSDASIIDGIDSIGNSELEGNKDDLDKDIYKIEGKIQLLEESLFKELKRDLNKELDEGKSKILDEIELLKEDSLLLSSDISKVKGANLIKRSQIDEISVKIDDLKKNNFLKDIEKLNDKIAPLNELLKNTQNNLNSFTKRDFSKECDKLNVDIDTMHQEIESNDFKIHKYNKDKQKLLKSLEEIEIKLSGKIKCPSCSHEFLKDDTTSLEEVLKNKELSLDSKLNIEIASNKLNEHIKAIENDIKEPTKRLLEIDKLIEEDLIKEDELKVAIRKVNSKIDSENDNLRKLEQRSDSNKKFIQLYKDKILDIERIIAKNDSKIASLKSNILNNSSTIKANKELLDKLTINSNKKLIESIKSDLNNLSKDKNKLEAKHKEAENLLHKLNEWSINFKQFKMHIANLSLNTIQYHCNRFLEGMGTDLKIRYDGYKVLADGSVKDSITAVIIRNGERSLGSFSAGEQGRIIFASILANRFMINNAHPYGGLQFLSIDEVFEGVDSLGLQSLVEESQKLKECIMIISHITDEDIVCDNLMIVKENGISKII